MEKIRISSGGQVSTAELYQPSMTAKGGLIVIAYGSDGLTNDLSGQWATMIRGYATSLVAKGFTALIPDYLGYTRTTPGPGVFELIPRYRDAWQNGLAAAIDHASTLATIGPKRIGLLGFSLGGHLCLRLRGKANVLVEFFAPVMDSIENAVTITNALKAEGTATELFPYPSAGHGFIGNDHDNTQARALSKERTMQFFQAHL